MTRHYDRPIQVVCRADDAGAVDHTGVGVPARIVWRETAYRVRAVLARWHLRARWWAAGPGLDGTGEGEDARAEGESAGDAPATDRYYFRLRCVPELICVVYYETASGVWSLEAVYD